MTESFEFHRPANVVPGAIGVPGARTFFLQADEDGRVVSFKLEKQQVAALCEYLTGMLGDLPAVRAEERVIATDADSPLGFAWVVGRLAVAYEEFDDRLVIVAEELLELDEDDVAELESLDEQDVFAALGLEPASARFHLSRAQVAAFIAVGEELVRSGRPTCRLCSRPIDPSGHSCPGLN